MSAWRVAADCPLCRRALRLRATGEVRWLLELRREAEREAERHGLLRGRIRPEQRIASWTLDVIERAEQELAS